MKRSILLLALLCLTISLTPMPFSNIKAATPTPEEPAIFYLNQDNLTGTVWQGFNSEGVNVKFEFGSNGKLDLYLKIGRDPEGLVRLRHLRGSWFIEDQTIYMVIPKTGNRTEARFTMVGQVTYNQMYGNTTDYLGYVSHWTVAKKNIQFEE